MQGDDNLLKLRTSFIPKNRTFLQISLNSKIKKKKQKRITTTFTAMGEREKKNKEENFSDLSTTKK